MSTGVSAPRIIIVGAPGRMGTRLCALAHEQRSLTAALARASSSRIGQPSVPSDPSSPRITADLPAGAQADVIIDFSHESQAIPSALLAAKLRASLLTGTTGLSPTTIANLRDHAKSTAILVAPNTSLGVAVLASLARTTATMLPGFAISITEAHHSLKKDAPSGTALRLAQSLRDGGANVSKDQLLSIRGGDVIGEHTIRLAGPGEYLELTHRATSRDLFATGALRCAHWLKGRAPGWYTMEDVLGLPAR